MAQSLNNSFVSTNIPGAYYESTVKSSASGAGASGFIAIIGEADGGPDFSAELLKNNYYSPDQFSKVQQKYLSGPIVEAMMALTSPSNDSGITGAPNRIYIVKTNAGAKATAAIASYGSLSDKNFGIAGNKYNYQVTQIDSEVGPSVTSSPLSFAVPSFYDGIAFSVRVDGGASSIVTIPSTGYASAALLSAQIASLLPAGLTCVSDSLATITIKAVVDSAANAKGYSKSFELFDVGSVDLPALGFSNGVVKSSVEPKIQVDINRSDIALNEHFIVSAEVAMNIGYVGTSCTLSINATTLSTVISGGLGANLSVDLSHYHTVKDLCDFINSQTGYTCSVVASSTSNPTSVLDEVSAVGIATSSAVAAVGIKKSVQNFKNQLAASTKLDAVVSAIAGLPSSTGGVLFLSGGLKGATSSASIVAALLACEGIQTNFVVPLFSRDYTTDIADGLTDSNSTYTIDAINASVKSHVLKMSTAKNKKHRTCILSCWDTFVNSQTKSHELASARCSLAFQRVSQVNSAGVVTSFLPWYGAVIAAGMQTAGFYKSITNKLANVISYNDPADFDSGSIGDLETAIDAGLLILQPDTAGVKFCIGNTTWGLDNNFVYNDLQCMYTSDLLALDLSASLQRVYVGQSLADISISSVKSYIQSKMDIYRKSKLIAPSSDAATGYKNLSVSIQGPVMNVAVEVKLSSSILFIPISLTISEISL